MKKILLFFVLYPVCIFAQMDNAKVLIKLTGGYNDFGTSNGVASLGAVNAENTAWNIGLSVGTLLGKHWEAGIGAGYEKAESTALSEMLLLQSANAQLTRTNAHIWMGKVYVAGYWRLFNQLYFHPNFSLTYGKGKGERSDQTAYYHQIAASPSIQDSPYSYFYSNTQDYSYNYQSISLAPGFSFFITKHLAVHLETGRFQLGTSEWEWDSRQWTADLNPSYWTVGIIAAF
jgi:hypothetical protein